jgi:hypothetical protein
MESSAIPLAYNEIFSYIPAFITRLLSLIRRSRSRPTVKTLGGEAYMKFSDLHPTSRNILPLDIPNTISGLLDAPAAK